MMEITHRWGHYSRGGHYRLEKGFEQGHYSRGTLFKGGQFMKYGSQKYYICEILIVSLVHLAILCSISNFLTSTLSFNRSKKSDI